MNPTSARNELSFLARVRSALPQTPPVASVVLITCAIAKISIGTISPSMLWFIGTMLIALILINVFPASSLWLPSVLL